MILRFLARGKACVDHKFTFLRRCRALSLGKIMDSLSADNAEKPIFSDKHAFAVKHARVYASHR